ncbi:hypothetical protein KEM56_006310 [Ascosphaera pollenicola]|nr:hypothetical protein KEM56_006310 [Ascosphaera pollenicola]
MGNSTMKPTGKPGLEEAENTLLNIASNDRRDVLVLSEKEEEVLRLYDLLEEQRLERALLMQDYQEDLREDDMDGAIQRAQKELLEAKSLYEVSRNATQMMLMTDPGVRAVHSDSMSTTEQDTLSMVHQNLENSRLSCIKAFNNAEIENLQLIDKNRELVQSVSALVRNEKPWREDVTDSKTRSQLEKLEAEQETAKAKYVTMKRIVAATIVASGVDWAADERLTELVLDDEQDL